MSSDGGPMFPSTTEVRADGEVLNSGSYGASVRVWLAGLAMRAAVTRDSGCDVRDVGRDACAVVDAVLAELSKEPKGVPT